jgi:pimeloyl-ACP methyl ester carboxylesterase
MILFFLATLLSAVFCLADAPSDTLYVKRWGKPLNGPILVSAGAKSTDVPVGVWRLPNNKSTAGTILWFHGGMTSGNCQKGLVAGSDLAKLLPKYTIVSASACKQNHWVDESTIQSVDNALDSLAKRSGKKIDEVSLVGISDGSLGVIAYSLWGKRKVQTRVLMSSYGASLGPAAQVAAQVPLRSGRWRFIQGGADRLYPADATLPWIQEFCQNVGTICDLKFDPQGEHDWSYWQNKRKEWILEFFSK